MPASTQSIRSDLATRSRRPSSVSTNCRRRISKLISRLMEIRDHGGSCQMVRADRPRDWIGDDVLRQKRSRSNPPSRRIAARSGVCRQGLEWPWSQRSFLTPTRKWNAQGIQPRKLPAWEAAAASEQKVPRRLGRFRGRRAGDWTARWMLFPRVSVGLGTTRWLFAAHSRPPTGTRGNISP